MRASCSWTHRNWYLQTSEGLSSFIFLYAGFGPKSGLNGLCPEVCVLSACAKGRGWSPLASLCGGSMDPARRLAPSAAAWPVFLRSMSCPKTFSSLSSGWFSSTHSSHVFMGVCIVYSVFLFLEGFVFSWGLC